MSSTSHESSDNQSTRRTVFLSLAALGVVFGDIGTSPLYAIKECFLSEHGLSPTPENIMGTISLVFWALVTIVSVKYLIFVFRADNKGEGGELALLALARRGLKPGSKSRRLVIVLGVIGASLLYGDGVITPAISVLSAVEGLEVQAPELHAFVVPITILILILLFYFQRSGTARLGILFGPIILCWFAILGILGVRQILEAPQILGAINPLWGLKLLISGQQGRALATLGTVFLVTTGAEALYADLGHFGKKPIRLAWFSVAFPGLLLNYFGQGALLLENPEAAQNPFFRMVPGALLIPLVLLATCATVIASQALISGAFSLTSQAIQLDFFPRIRVLHTSSTESGQIYIPAVNWFLFLGTVVVVLAFRSSSSLAGAYGIGVATTMVITTILIFFVARNMWKWPRYKMLGILTIFLIVDLGFLSANSGKFFDGGYVSVMIAAVLFTFMMTWWEGRFILYRQLKSRVPRFKDFIESLDSEVYSRTPGTAVFMIRDLNLTPTALLYNLQYNRVVHERVVLLSVVIDEYPHLPADRERVDLIDMGRGFYRVVTHFGFMETPDVPSALDEHCRQVVDLSSPRTVFFMDRILAIPSPLPGMAKWREHLFAFLQQNSIRATGFFKIPAEQVIEIGFQVEI